MPSSAISLFKVFLFFLYSLASDFLQFMVFLFDTSSSVIGKLLLSVCPASINLMHYFTQFSIKYPEDACDSIIKMSLVNAI